MGGGRAGNGWRRKCVGFNRSPSLFMSVYVTVYKIMEAAARETPGGESLRNRWTAARAA